LAKTLKKQDVDSERRGQPATAAQRGNETVLARDDFDRDIWCVLGLPVDAMDVNQAMAAIDQAVRQRKSLSFVTPNVNWLVRALREPQARREVLNADLSLIDGAPLEAIAKWVGAPIKGRVAGSDLFEALRRRPGFAGRRIKVFFFGGREGAAKAAAAALNTGGGGLEAVGWLNPGFGDVESMSADALINSINAADADFVVVALGAAKGQAWIERNRTRLDAPVIAHLGAVVDFTAGALARAPVLIRRLGLEWMWRVAAEPALWRRYAHDGLALLRHLAIRAPALRRARAPRDGASAPKATLVKSEPATRIALTGAVDAASGLAGVRAAFREAAGAGGDVVVDISGARSIDHAFLGLLLMLEKHVARARRTVFVDGASRRQLAFLRANAMNYPASAASGPKLPNEAAA